jgi:hypothetical protein
MSLIVHINGWPGTGKLTIARLLAQKLGARLLDNHTLLNPAETLFKRQDPLHGSLRAEIRRVVLDHVARMSAETKLILTDAFSEDPYEAAMFDDYRDLAARRGARLVSVELLCSVAENLRRLGAPGRSEQLKLTNAKLLAEWRDKFRLLRPPGVERIEIDVTELAAPAAADALYAKLKDLPERR